MKILLRAVLATAVIALLGARAGMALCIQCDGNSLCHFPDWGGAYWCHGTGVSCVQVGRCVGGGRQFSDLRSRPVAVLLTLHEDDARHRPLIGASGGRRVFGAGSPGSLDDARRAAADALGSPGAGARVVSGRFLVGSGRHALAFRSPGGGGYTLRAEPDGGGVRLTLKELSGPGPARLSARETIGEGGALVARIRLEGRPYLAVLRALVLDGDDATLSRRLVELQRPFYDELRALPEGPDSRFEVAETAE